MKWLLEYLASQKLAVAVHECTANGANEFYTLMMTALRFAGSEETAKIRAAFPDLAEILQQRYDTPGGLLPGESARLSDGRLYHRDYNGVVTTDPEGSLQEQDEREAYDG